MSEKLVVILSRVHSTGLSVTRCLGKAGYTIDLIASTHTADDNLFITSSKYIRNFIEVVSDKDRYGEDEAILFELLKYKGKYDNKPVLFPTDDYSSAVIDTYRVELEEVFVMPGVVNGRAGDLKILTDKTIQNKMAHEVGLLTAKEWVVSLRKEIIIPDDIIYPCFVKPIESITGYKTEMAKCQDEDELRRHLYRLKNNNSDRDILVQEFLEIEKELAWEGVCLDQEIVLPAVTYATLVGEHEKGVMAAGYIVPNNRFGECEDQLIKLLQSFHYYGLFNLQFYIVGGRLYFNEINLRSGGYNFVYFNSGVNHPAILVKNLLGEKHLPNETHVNAFDKKFVYERVAWEDYLHGNISREMLNDTIESAEIFNIKDENDPDPYEIFVDNMNAREERMLRNAEIRESSVHELMRITGQNQEIAEGLIADARERLGISSRDFVDQRMWELSVEKQAEEYRKLRNRRIYNSRRREQCIDYAVSVTGLDRDAAKTIVDDAKSKLGITYPEYMRYGLCTVPAEEQEEYLSKARIDEEDSFKPQIVILSYNGMNGLSVIRALGKEGYRIQVVSIVNKANEGAVLSSSKYVSRSTEIVLDEEQNSDSIVISELMKEEGASSYKRILIPVDMESMLLVDHNRNELEKCYTLPSIIKGGENAISKVTNKEHIKSLAKQAAMLTRDEKNLACNKEKIFTDYAITGICLGDEIIIPAAVRQIKSAQSDRASVTAGELISFDEFEDRLQTKIVSVLQSLQYFGIFEMRFSCSGSKGYFDDIIFGASEFINLYLASGTNVPEMYVREAWGKRHLYKNEKAKTYGKTFVSEQAAWNDYINGILTKKEMQQIISSADVGLVHDDDDSRPGEVFSKEMKRQERRSYLNKLFHRD